MSVLTEKVDAFMAKLQTKVDEYNQLGTALEKTKEEIISLQGAINVLRELQSEEKIAPVPAEIVS